jgi:hypothetical protein
MRRRLPRLLALPVMAAGDIAKRAAQDRPQP